MTEEGPIIVCVVGIIGAAKSTIIEKLQESGILRKTLKSYYNGVSPNIVFVQENSEEWKKSGDLERFYSDKKKYAYWFQTKVLDSFIDNALDSLEENPDIIFMERTVYCQRIFWEVQVETGCCEHHEDRAYRGDDLSGDKGIWSKWKNQIPKPDIIAYAKTTKLKTTMSRVKSRNRLEETVSRHTNTTTKSSVDLDYQTRLFNGHEKAYTKGTCTPFGDESIVCVHINTDSDFREDDAVLTTNVIYPLWIAIKKVISTRAQAIEKLKVKVDK